MPVDVVRMTGRLNILIGWFAVEAAL